ncbi:MAG: hypothetical protein VXX30_03615 [Planctomycetota bacterium]|nr:hypothetical protein [Planctomycetota bacterium]
MFDGWPPPPGEADGHDHVGELVAEPHHPGLVGGLEFDHDLLLVDHPECLGEVGGVEPDLDRVALVALELDLDLRLTQLRGPAGQHEAVRREVHPDPLALLVRQERGPAHGAAEFGGLEPHPLVLVLRDDVLERRELPLHEVGRQDRRIRPLADLEDRVGILLGDLDGHIGVVDELVEDLQGLGGEDEGLLLDASLGPSLRHCESTSVGRHEPQVLSPLLHQDATDREPAVLHRGGEEGPPDQPAERPAGAFEDFPALGELADPGEFLGVEPEDLEVGVLAANVEHRLVSLERDRGILAGPGDLVELVRGHQGPAGFLHLHLRHSDRDAHLRVGGGHGQEPVLGSQSEAPQHRRGGSAWYDAPREGECFD